MEKTETKLLKEFVLVGHAKNDKLSTERKYTGRMIPEEVGRFFLFYVQQVNQALLVFAWKDDGD